MMEIHLTLHGILRDYLPPKLRGKTTLDLPDNATIAQVVNQLQIKQNVSAAINGSEVETDHILQDGEDLHLFRFIAGG